jgi:hypothetical protein
MCISGSVRKGAKPYFPLFPSRLPLSPPLRPGSVPRRDKGAPASVCELREKCALPLSPYPDAPVAPRRPLVLGGRRGRECEKGQQQGPKGAEAGAGAGGGGSVENCERLTSQDERPEDARLFVGLDVSICG